MRSLVPVVLVVLLALTVIDVVRGQGESCTTPPQEPGTCVLMPDCPYVVDLLRPQPRTRDVANYVVAAQINCGRRAINRTPIVCCATPGTAPPVTEAPTSDDTVLVPDDSRNEDGCTGPDGRTGSCLPIRSCPVIVAELQQAAGSAEYAQYLRNSNTVCQYQNQVICCPQANGPQQTPAPPPQTAPPTAAPPTPRPRSNGVPHLLTLEERCGEAKNIKYTKVVGGVEANKGSMPWMALIGYTDSLGDIGWKCGGSLISSRHILTAAHCLKSTLTTVRLGEHDLNSPAASAINVNVVKAARYPNYDPKDGHADLAVLYLEHDVQFSDFIRPICLPLQDPVRSRDFVGYNPFVAGWGRLAEGGKPSNVLQQLQLPVLENSVCKEKYRDIKKLISEKQFDNAVLCAGELGGGKDSCQGDSGGPLMQPVSIDGVPNFYQIGIVSYGIGCARADVPGVYTRVQTFVDWIRDKVAEQ